MDSITIILSESGKELALVNLYKYELIGVHEDAVGNLLLFP